MRVLVLLLALWVAGGASAQIYKWVLPDGTVQYSDRPQSPDAEKVDIKPVQGFDPPALPPSTSSSSGQAQDEGPGYREFKVSAPENDQTIIDNNGNVPVTLSVTPSLQSGHTVDVVFDGEVSGSGRSLSLTLTNVDRGSHTVSAVIRDGDGKEVARAPSITFHLRRPNIRPRTLPTSQAGG